MDHFLLCSFLRESAGGGTGRWAGEYFGADACRQTKLRREGGRQEKRRREVRTGRRYERQEKLATRFERRKAVLEGARWRGLKGRSWRGIREGTENMRGGERREGAAERGRDRRE